MPEPFALNSPYRSLILCGLVTIATGISQAAITTTGDVAPTYDGFSDPWDAGFRLSVGNEAEGRLTVTDGSVVRTDILDLAGFGGGAGTAIVSGNGSRLEAESFVGIGAWGPGELLIEEGAIFTTGSFARIGGINGNGVVTVDGLDSSWDADGQLQIGLFNSGRLEVSNGASVNSREVELGVVGFANGIASLTGAGTLWSISEHLIIGNQADGRVEIGPGAGLLVSGTTFVDFTPGGEGLIELAPGAAFETLGLVAGLNDLAGSGVVQTRGLVTDLNLSFSSHASLRQTFVLDQGTATERTIELDATDPQAVGPMGAGFRANAELSVTSGTELVSRGGYLGYHPGSNGTAIVSGIGSSWISTNDLFLGRYGSGVLRVLDSGALAVEGDLEVGVDGDGELVLDATASAHVVGITSLGSGSNGSGRVVLDGGTLVTGALVADLREVQGPGRIEANGFVADVDLVLDRLASKQQEFLVGATPENQFQLAIDLTGEVPVLGVGHSLAGKLVIQNGVRVESTAGRLGIRAGSEARAVVSGVGSHWGVDRALSVGEGGNASLAVLEGGSVAAQTLSVGGSDGLLEIRGPGSTVSAGFLDIGVGFLSGQSPGSEPGGTVFVADGAVLETSGVQISYRTFEPLSSSYRSVLVATGRGTLVSASGTLSVEGEEGLQVLQGAEVRTGSLVLDAFGSPASATVSGQDSVLFSDREILFYGVLPGSSSSFLIEEGGLVAADRLTFLRSEGVSIRMATGGVLALESGISEGILAVVEYRADDAWLSLSEGELGIDYWLDVATAGEFAGYTLLTVGRPGLIPEPSTLLMLVLPASAAFAGPRLWGFSKVG